VSGGGGDPLRGRCDAGGAAAAGGAGGWLLHMHVHVASACPCRASDVHVHLLDAPVERRMDPDARVDSCSRLGNFCKQLVSQTSIKLGQSRSKVTWADGSAFRGRLSHCKRGSCAVVWECKQEGRCLAPSREPDTEYGTAC